MAMMIQWRDDLLDGFFGLHDMDLIVECKHLYAEFFTNNCYQLVKRALSDKNIDSEPMEYKMRHVGGRLLASYYWHTFRCCDIVLTDAIDFAVTRSIRKTIMGVKCLVMTREALREESRKITSGYYDSLFGDNVYRKTKHRQRLTLLECRDLFERPA
jgi:hypothetical protein